MREFVVAHMTDGYTQEPGRVAGERWVFSSEREALEVAANVRAAENIARREYELRVYEKRGSGQSDRRIAVFTERLPGGWYHDEQNA